MRYLLIFICCCFNEFNNGSEQINRYFSEQVPILAIRKIAGSALYNTSDQTYSIRGSGYNIWFARDEFHYLYNKIKGDFILTANFKFEGKGTEAHRKTGWMLRASTDENSSSYFSDSSW